MTERYDAVVVGAGPAGSTAAHDLGRAGARVLLLDRARFPRDKPCGGGVLISALQRLPFDLHPVAERTIHTFRIRYARGREIEHRWPQPLAIMTQRSRLDAFLSERAADAGATFRDGVGVRSLELTSPAPPTLRLDNGDTIEAGMIIAADGANGIVRRSLGLPRMRAAIALEGNVDRTNAPNTQRWTDSVGLELGSMRGGYRWIFPKGDHLNLGVGGYPALAPSLRKRLAAYARHEGFDPHDLRDPRAHHLPLRDPDSALAQGRILFVGDAAGLVDPLSGEGIGNAIHSAQLAAHAALSWLDGNPDGLDHYPRAVETKIIPDLNTAWQLQSLFHQLPWPYVQLLQRLPPFWGACCQIVRGENSYARIQSRLGPAARLVAEAAAWADRRQRRHAGWQSP